ncbi:NRDE-2, necessary for RNA interference-domain-containing protein [Collybia nuda]|uniref:NRDE-2, necessary for RNA interference-domain-containing protein n=1 Tax=Collybia nuda TaxID=64659 RepID=A0A9P5Y6M3_9AGAR|nr:NRDE-2, necessary for RNA interference-domain-containing protein [Collybia nuda]
MVPPSFASFPKLDTHLSKYSDIESRNLKEHPVESGKSRHNKRKEKKRKQRGRSKDVDSIPLPSDDERRKTIEDVHLRDSGLTRFFYSDKKGDPLNLRYGGLCAGDVPKYSLVDRGRRILGMPSGWTAFQRRNGIEVALSNRQKMPGLSDSKSRALLAAPPTRRITQTSGTSRYEEFDGFIRLPSGRASDRTEPLYRSITWPKNSDELDSEFSSASDDDGSDYDSGDDSDTLVLTTHQETLKVLGQQATANPSSIETWLLLLSHTLSTIPESSKNANKVRSEITLSILGRALAADQRNGNSKLLRLKYMKAGEEIWHESKLRAEWEDALKVEDFGIQLEWLEWKIGKGKFGVDGITKDTIRMLAMLDHSERGEATMLRIFWRVAVAFQKAGYPERATAMFQAQAELLYRSPSSLQNASFQSQLDLLEAFWESEVLRTGEDGAQGLASWQANYRSPQQTRALIKSSLSATDLDPYRQWAMQEMQADLYEIIPTRSTQESQGGDPYSIVLFSDIRSLLLDLHSTRLKNAFRLMWLSFLGLHIPGFSDWLSASDEVNWDDRWSNGHLQRSSYLEALLPADMGRSHLATDAVAGVIVGREKDYTSGFGPVRSWGYCVLGPLEVPTNGGFSKGSGIWDAKDVAGLNERLVRSVFSQLRQGGDDFEWDVLALAFEAATNIKSAIKLSRSFLSTQRQSISHWAVHARLERARGRVNDARKIYQTVLLTSAPRTAEGRTSLWWDWAEMEWLEGDQEQAFNVILRSVGIEGRSDIVTLRAKRTLEDSAKEEGRHKEREAWIKLRALFELLATREPSGALRVFDEYLHEKNNISYESLTVASLFMLYHHSVVLKVPMAPLVLRERVAKALDEYPDNSLVMGLFLEGEKGQGIWGRVRERLGNNGGNTKSVSRRIAEVWIAGWERGRWKSEIERTRSGLAAAVDNVRTRSSHVLWRVYLEFEIKAKQLQLAKKLLFRAIAECPLVKELYLLAFGPLRSVFSAHELRAMADTMAERGIRLRRGLEEGLVGWKETKATDMDSSGESGDEIEEDARELRRLMPY